ncbi:ABC transporter ATP-binding protein [Ottowia sp. GY511]|uniref:ABC transporter ATP-binding protein n=1 Tax=Ottowia flava TaxID=2675430 RepID=A0ABW4KRG0_9BURK|nr:ABC transporter ATP-binding protein [Ottowia sp. GY511]TXK31022.1 ABC transporter ATP-binding protein [Ottowia sp. GY511]
MADQAGLLTCQGLSVHYGTRLVLDGVSVAFASGRLTALMGPNGCGKSTLLKAVMGIVRSQGIVTLGGAPVRSIPRRALATRIAWLPQDNHCPDYLTLAELVALGGYARERFLRGTSDADQRRFAQALRTVGLFDQARQQVNTLSGGQRQRAWIAMILAQDTGVVLLDEPVNHLDLRYQYAVLELIHALAAQHGKTVVCVLHDLNLAAAFADDVVLMQSGVVFAQGATRSVLTQANVQAVFDQPVDMLEWNGRQVCVPRRCA